MAIGQFLLFLSACYFHEVALAKYLMFCGLGLLILGNGFFKPNISTMVGRLYTPDDNRKDSAFTIFYMGVNVGSTIAPLVCGLVGNTGHPEDFKWGFLSACIGMLLGAGVFQLFKNKYICDPDGNPVGTAPQKTVTATTSAKGNTQKKTATGRTILMIGSTLILTLLFSVNWGAEGGALFAGADWIGSLIYATAIVMPIFIITDHSLTRHEKVRIGVIYIIAFFVIFFWAAYEQAGASLTFFADEQTDRHIGLLPVVQPYHDCHAGPDFCRRMVVLRQEGHRTELSAQAGYRTGTAGLGLPVHCFRSEKRGTWREGQHGMAHRSLPDSYHGRTLPGTHRPLAGLQTLAGPFFFPADGRVVPQYLGGQQICRTAERLLSGARSEQEFHGLPHREPVRLLHALCLHERGSRRDSFPPLRQAQENDGSVNAKPIVKTIYPAKQAVLCLKTSLFHIEKTSR